MSFQNPAHSIPRLNVDGMEAMWAKMFDPPNESRPTPDEVTPTNPVPAVMAAAGLQDTPSVANTVQRQLLHGLTVPTWDGAKNLFFMTFRDGDNDATGNGVWPGPTIRVPRGAIFHAETQGSGPPPHTIHWHGIEPTPMNDGVGHCSMEIGQYVYQWQPNFIGTYFYHCHRNTVQHFEFGLYGMLLIDPPDAFFATQVDPTIPIGACRDGKRRTAANLNAPLTGLRKFPQFPGFNSNLLTAPDPLANDPTVDSRVKFATDPHAMTVTYDVEALWVPDDRDSVWSDLADNARDTFPQHGTIPGVNDNFFGDAGSPITPADFFAFNDFNADYWFVTGVPVPAPKGGTAAIPPNIVIPPQLMSGVSGVQVSISAQTGQTVFLRCLDAAYNNIRVTFPLNVVIIAWDGRALGVPPYGHNEAQLLPANTPMLISVARRFDALIRSNTPINSFATVEFLNTRGQNVPGFPEEVLMTARIPIVIGGDPQPAAVFDVSGRVTDQLGNVLAGVSVTVNPVSLGGSASRTVVTDANGNFTATGLVNSSYVVTPTLPGVAFTPLNRTLTVNDQNLNGLSFAVDRKAREFTPGSYDITEALDSLRIQVRLKDQIPGDLGRYDVFPAPTGDNLLDLRDVLNVLRMAVELSPV